MDELDAIEKKALEQAVASDDLEVRRKAMEIATAVSEKRKLMMETTKILLDTKEASLEYKFGRTKYWASTLTPLFAVLLTGAALLAQTWQYQSSAKLQVDVSEESQWRDAIKNVSMKDTGTTLISAFAMRTFFDSPHYSVQARTVAATPLPHVDNPDGFDNVLFDMLYDNSKSNQSHIVAVAKTLFNSQLDLYRVSVLANQPVKLEFGTLREILGDDDPPIFIQQDIASRKQAVAAAWMLDSVRVFGCVPALPRAAFLLQSASSALLTLRLRSLLLRSAKWKPQAIGFLAGAASPPADKAPSTQLSEFSFGFL